MRQDGLEDLEVRTAVHTALHGLDRLALLIGGGLVDHQLSSAVALVDRTRPGHDEGEANAGEADVTEVPVAYLPGDQRPAVTVRGFGVELAGARPHAVAAGRFLAADAPRSLCRGSHAG